MNRTLKNTLFGAGVGCAAGCAVSVAKVIGNLCPALWIPGNALSYGAIAYKHSDGDPLSTALGAVGGASLGTAMVIAYPVFATINTVGAIIAPAVGTAIGGYLGYKA